jgi:plastocyanin
VATAFALTACGSGDGSGNAPRLEEAEVVGEVEHDYVIPAGTGERLDAGEEVEIMPSVLEATVGETIRIVNDDDRGHVVGVFFVGAGETLTQTFTSAGEFSGRCTVHTDGEFTLRVTE